MLDIGSGCAIDVLLSACRVGPSGKVYGLDMTAEMITLDPHRRPGVELQRRLGVALGRAT